MKTVDELIGIAGRVSAELEIGTGRLGAARRLRQLEHDAILDFVDLLFERTDALGRQTGSYQTAYQRVATDLFEELHIIRTPPAGCKDGKCGCR